MILEIKSKEKNIYQLNRKSWQKLSNIITMSDIDNLENAELKEAFDAFDKVRTVKEIGYL